MVIQHTLPQPQELKQGCIMSPLLSNIFQNDLHEIFDESCDPIDLNNMTLNSISWADLVLCSLTKQVFKTHLINCAIIVINGGCQLIQEKLNACFLSLGNAKMPNFMFDDKILENVQTYKYLGIMMHKNGKIYKCDTGQNI